MVMARWRHAVRLVVEHRGVWPFAMASKNMVSGRPADKLDPMAGGDEREHDDQVKRRRRAHQRAATRHERAARTEREAADTSEVFDDAQAAEHHREAARRHEGDADDERHKADDQR